MKKKIVSLLLIPLLLLCGCDFNGGNEVSNKILEEYWDMSQVKYRKGTHDFDFYNLNDFHGAVSKETDAGEPGISLLSTFLKNRYEESNGYYCLTSSGDMWQGGAESNITYGGVVVEWMNYLDFKAQAIGNHEFDWGVDKIKANMNKTNFPIIGCNIYDKNTNQPVDWIEPVARATIKGLRVGFVGAIGEGLTSDILASNVKDLSFIDPTANINKYAKELKETGADIVVLLLHDSEDNLGHINNVDFAFAGHTHSYYTSKINYSIPCVQAGCNGKDVAHIKVSYNFSSKSKNIVNTEFIDTRTFRECANLEKDPGTEEIYQKSESVFGPVMNQIAVSNSRTISRDVVPLVYNLAAYSYYLEQSECTLPIYATVTNNARSNIVAVNGNITYGAIYKALPFDNYLNVVSMTGRNIMNTICNYGSAHFTITGTNEIISGYSFSNSLEPNKTYNLLIIDYIAQFYPQMVTFEHIYTSEETLPRNLVFNYLPKYFAR